MSQTSLAGKSAIVTGAGAGLGKAEAIALACAGADVVLNDLTEDVCADTAGEVEAAGAKAVIVAGDIGESATADALLAAAVQQYSGPQILVNNAGIVRDRMLFNMSDEEWDGVVRTHLRGHFLLSRNVAAHWRQQAKAEGTPVHGSVVNTASEAFLVGSEGQPNYAAAKAGIAALTVSTARAMARYGVRANAICPRARTAMTEGTFGPADSSGGPDPLSVEHVAPLVAYLASPAAERINGQVFVVHGGMVALLRPPSVRQRFDTTGVAWTVDELAGTVGDYFAEHDPADNFSATDILAL